MEKIIKILINIILYGNRNNKFLFNIFAYKVFLYIYIIKITLSKIKFKFFIYPFYT